MEFQNELMVDVASKLVACSRCGKLYPYGRLVKLNSFDRVCVHCFYK